MEGNREGIIMRRCQMKGEIRIERIGRKNMDIYKIMKKMEGWMVCRFLRIRN